MFCPACGQEAPEEAKFCQNCGQTLAGTASPTTAAAAEPDIREAYVRHRAAVKFAGFWLRFLAIIIDGIFISFVVIGAEVIVSQLSGVNLDLRTSGASRLQLGPALAIKALVRTLIHWLYWAGMEASRRQATLGKMALGLKVTDLEGEPISFARATGRYFGKYISARILGIGFMMAGWTAKKQALHDLMAGTLVVRK